MRWLLFALFAGCAADSGRAEDPGHPNTGEEHLPMDGHYILVGDMYTSVEDCLAKNENPWACSFTMTLCSTGKAGIRRGDVIYGGFYMLEGTLAHVELESSPATSFDFDTSTLILTDDHEQWQIDAEERWKTQEFDNISCEY